MFFFKFFNLFFNFFFSPKKNKKRDARSTSPPKYIVSTVEGPDEG